MTKKRRSWLKEIPELCFIKQRTNQNLQIFGRRLYVFCLITVDFDSRLLDKGHFVGIESNWL